MFKALAAVWGSSASLTAVQALRLVQFGVAVALLCSIELLRVSYLSDDGAGPSVEFVLAVIGWTLAMSAGLLWLLSRPVHFGRWTAALRYITGLMLLFAVLRGALDCVHLTLAAIEFPHLVRFVGLRCTVETLVLLLAGAALYDRTRRCLGRPLVWSARRR